MKTRMYACVFHLSPTQTVPTYSQASTSLAKSHPEGYWVAFILCPCFYHAGLQIHAFLLPCASAFTDHSSNCPSLCSSW